MAETVCTDGSPVPFRIRIASVVFEVAPLYPLLEKYCAAYLTKDPPSERIALTQDDIACESRISAEEDISEGQSVRVYPPAYLETLALYRKIAERLLSYDTLLFHGSCLTYDGTAYLFTAKSGTGKSTHTRLWRERFGDRVHMVNDDKPLIALTESCPIVYGTPWNGKHRLGENISAPLRAICLLTRAEKNTIERADRREIYPRLLAQVYRPTDPLLLMRTMTLFDRLLSSVDLYLLGCLSDIEAAEIAARAMTAPNDHTHPPLH